MKKALRAAALLGDYACLAARLPAAAAPPAAAKLERVLFLGYAAVGDLIFMLPALKALRQGLPKARIVFAGDRDPGATELMPATGLVDEIWTFTHPELATRKVQKDIQTRVLKEKFDAVIVNQATPLRPFARALLKIPLRVGHLRRLESGDLWSDVKRAMATSEYERRWVLNKTIALSEKLGPHTVVRHLQLIDLLGLKTPEAARSRPGLPVSPAAAAFAEKNLPALPGKKTVGLHLGSPLSQYKKIWPAERWPAVCRQLSEKLSCRFVLIGGPDEVPEAARFKSAFSGDCVDLVGKAGLLESFAAIARCDLFLSSDTGLSKAAMALRVPTVSVWGPVSPRDVGVIWDKELHAEVSLKVACSPCVFMALGAEGPGVINFSNCGHHRCLADLQSEQVVETVLARHGERLRA